MKKTITTILLTLTINANAGNVLSGHLQKGMPINAAAQSPRKNPAYLINDLHVIIDKDMLGTFKEKDIYLKAYIQGETFDDRRYKYKYRILIDGYSHHPSLDQYKDIRGRFDNKYGWLDLESSNEKDFKVTHDLIKHEKWEQFTLTPTHDIPVTIYIEDFN